MSTPHAPIPFPATESSFASDQVKFRGVAFDAGERVLIIPALPMKALEPFDEEILKAGQQPEPDHPERGPWIRRREDLMTRVIVEALRRNYSAEKLSDGQIAEFLNYENLLNAYQAARGFMKEDVPRVKSPGELKPGQAPL